jgi:hypothetical protein
MNTVHPSGDTRDTAMPAGQGEIPRAMRLLIRAIYGAGILGTGYGLWDLLCTRGDFNPYASAGVTLLIEAFAVASATSSTRARLRNQSDILTRSVVYFGAVGSAAIQLAFHWADNRVIAVVLPLASILSLILWLLDVRDRHAAMFIGQAEELKQRRTMRRQRRTGIVAYAYANGFRRTTSEWKRRTVALGGARRRTDLEIALADDDARRPAIVGELVPTSDDRPGPYPPSIGPTSATPATLIPSMIDDAHADAMRDLPSVSACVRYAISLPEFGPHARPIDVVRWLAGYGLMIKPNTVSNPEGCAPAAIAAGPDDATSYESEEGR